MHAFIGCRKQMENREAVSAETVLKKLIRFSEDWALEDIDELNMMFRSASLFKRMEHCAAGLLSMKNHGLDEPVSDRISGGVK